MRFISFLHYYRYAATFRGADNQATYAAAPLRDEVIVWATPILLEREIASPGDSNGSVAAHEVALLFRFVVTIRGMSSRNESKHTRVARRVAAATVTLDQFGEDPSVGHSMVSISSSQSVAD
jgi:hypothetical protein